VLAGARSIVCLAASYHRTVTSHEPNRNAPHPALAPSDGERVASGRERSLFGAQGARSAEEGLPGMVARYARSTDYHDSLAARLEDLTTFMNQVGRDKSRSLWYVDTGPLLERDLAQRAGLGFIGKHTNLISRELGNWFFLSEIITTLELEPDVSE